MLLLIPLYIQSMVGTSTPVQRQLSKNDLLLISSRKVVMVIEGLILTDDDRGEAAKQSSRVK